MVRRRRKSSGWTTFSCLAMVMASAPVRSDRPPIGSPRPGSPAIRSRISVLRRPWRRQSDDATSPAIPSEAARSSKRARSTRPGSPNHAPAGAIGWTPQRRAAATTSSPTFRQSESLPPRTDTIRRPGSTSTACRRDNSVQSRLSSAPPGGTTSERTPQRSEITSDRMRGLERFSLALICSSRKSMSWSVTTTSGSSTRVSVVPITDRPPIGST